MRKTATGSCNCGKVRFDISLKPEDVYICHCSICRKSTGSGGIAVTVVENSAFHWISGEGNIRTWRKPGHDWETRFCLTCGSPLPGKNDENHTYIPVSLLDCGAQNLKVKQHLFTDSKADWEEIKKDIVG